MSKNLPEAINYQGYQIRPMPMKVIIKGNEQWNTHFEIWEHKGKESTVIPFMVSLLSNQKKMQLNVVFLLVSILLIVSQKS